METNSFSLPSYSAKVGNLIIGDFFTAGISPFPTSDITISDTAGDAYSDTCQGASYGNLLCVFYTTVKTTEASMVTSFSLFGGGGPAGQYSVNLAAWAGLPGTYVTVGADATSWGNPQSWDPPCPQVTASVATSSSAALFAMVGSWWGSSQDGFMPNLHFTPGYTQLSGNYTVPWYGGSNATESYLFNGVVNGADTATAYATCPYGGDLSDMEVVAVTSGPVSFVAPSAPAYGQIGYNSKTGYFNTTASWTQGSFNDGSKIVNNTVLIGTTCGVWTERVSTKGEATTADVTGLSAGDTYCGAVQMWNATASVQGPWNTDITVCSPIAVEFSTPFGEIDVRVSGLGINTVLSSTLQSVDLCSNNVYKLTASNPEADFSFSRWVNSGGTLTSNASKTATYDPNPVASSGDEVALLVNYSAGSPPFTGSVGDGMYAYEGFGLGDGGSLTFQAWVYPSNGSVLENTSITVPTDNPVWAFSAAQMFGPEYNVTASGEYLIEFRIHVQASMSDDAKCDLEGDTGDVNSSITLSASMASSQEWNSSSTQVSAKTPLAVSAKCTGTQQGSIDKDYTVGGYVNLTLGDSFYLRTQLMGWGSGSQIDVEDPLESTIQISTQNAHILWAKIDYVSGAEV